MTHYITWARHPDYAQGHWIKLFKGTNAKDTEQRRAQGFELRVMRESFHPENTKSRILTEDDKTSVFLRAVHSFSNAKERWRERAGTGLNDQDLWATLRYELGIAGGGGCRDSVKIEYQGAGLKIWGSWQQVMTSIDRPLFEGKQTVAMARRYFKIPNPDDKQLTLF